MALRAGRLRQRVTLMRKTRARNADGGSATSWAPVGGPIAAEVLGTGGSEPMIGEALQGVSYFRITTRYRPDITPSDQLAYGALTLNVRSAEDPFGRGEQTLIIADTGSPQKAA